MTEEAKQDAVQADPVKEEVTGTYSAADVEAMRANDKQAMERLHKKATKAEEQLAKIAEAEKEAERSKLEETERLKLEKDELLQELKAKDDLAQSYIVNSEIKLAGIQAGVNDVNDLLALVDKSGIQVQDGNLVGVNEAIAAMKEKKPYLFSQQKASGNLPDTGSPRKREQARQVSPEEYAEQVMKRNQKIWGLASPD